MELLQILLQCSSQTAVKDTSVLSIFFDFIKALIGPIIGFGVALLMFRKQTKKEEDRKEEERQQAFSDKLQYFAALVAEVPRIIESQAENYKIFSETTSKNKFIINLPSFTLKTALSRLTEKINQEDYFLAYINQFKEPSLRSDEVNKFKSIYEDLDYFDYLLSQSVESVKEMRFRIRQAMEDFRQTSSDVEKISASLVNSKTFIEKHLGFVQLIDGVLQQFIINKEANRTNLTFVHDALLYPIVDSLVKTGAYSEPEFFELTNKVREARILYSRVEFLSNQQAEEFAEYSSELLVPLENFKERIEQISKLVAQ